MMGGLQNLLRRNLIEAMKEHDKDLIYKYLNQEEGREQQYLRA